MAEMTQKGVVDPAETLDVVSTSPGVFNANGVAPIGTKARVSVQGYSARWMRPANRKSAALLDRAGILPDEYKTMLAGGAERQNRIIEIIKTLGDVDKTDSGIPRVDAINAKLDPDDDPLTAKERDRILMVMSATD